MLRRVVLAMSVLALFAGCSGDDDGDDDDDAAPSPSSVPVSAVVVRSFEPVVPLCADLPDPADSLDWSGLQRTDAPSPARTRDALIRAMEFPYVVDFWGGTGTREGWIVIGVSGGAVELQSMLDMYHPYSRVLAMPLDWTPGELLTLADEVDAATASLGVDPAVVSISRGVVRVQLDTITERRVEPLAGFADRRVCLDGELA